MGLESQGDTSTLTDRQSLSLLIPGGHGGDKECQVPEIGTSLVTSIQEDDMATRAGLPTTGQKGLPRPNLFRQDLVVVKVFNTS